MRRIRRLDAICLHIQEYKESSKLVTLLTADHGRVTGLAKGARRPKSKFGAALDLFARSRIIYYWHESRSLYTISDAELVNPHSGIALRPERYLAAEQITELALRTAPPQDQNPQLFGLLDTYLGVIEQTETGFATLVGSFLLKAASFGGFRPGLRQCLRCRQPIREQSAWFAAEAGGIICPSCASDEPGVLLSPTEIGLLDHLLHTPASSLTDADAAVSRLLPVILDFVQTHFPSLLLRSFRPSPI